MAPLEDLRFDNTVLHELPVDESKQQGVRQVRGAVYSLVDPTPLREPCLVASCADALALLGLDAVEAERPEFTQVMCGNSVLTDQGSRPAAHCYCGYQFGYFAGQLGDGAAIYLGEVVHPATGVRQELQLKGAGLTPFSRSADGRKVLRSSMREFLASEAMDALGIPTTRAGSLVVSGRDQVLRDVTYSGNAAMEPCAVVSRIAPTFIRFGSFEVAKPPDPQTGRAGPSAGQAGQLLLPLVGYVIRHHHSDIWAYYGGGADVSMAGMAGSQVRDMVETWFAEVCRRTARLVAAWQGVGFVHGVLNTDNMSITGLTLDYGPYGFMDRYGSQHVPNGSDDGARYTYEAQPGICRWNCERLAEALASVPLPDTQQAAAGADAAAGVDAAGGVEGAAAAARSILPVSASRKALALYDDEYVRMYRAIMRRKLGLLGKAAATAAAAAAAATAAASTGDAASAAAGSSAAAAAAAAAGAGAGAGAAAAPATARPAWPLSAGASAEVSAAAAAVAAAPLQPGSGQLDEVDDRLAADLLTLMEQTGADFTNTFRRLTMVPMPPPSSSSSKANDSSSSNAADAAAGSSDGGQDSSNAAGSSGSDASGAAAADDHFGGFLPLQLAELATPGEMASASQPNMPLEQAQMLSMLAGKDPAMLHMLGINPGTLAAQLARHKAAAKWGVMTQHAKSLSDAAQWSSWLRRYRDRLQREADEGVTLELRRSVMAASNPRVVLRNWVAQTAIHAAELGQYDTVASVLDLLRDPYRSEGEAVLTVPPAVAAAAGGAAAAAAPAGSKQQDEGEGGGGGGGSCPASVQLRFDGKPPAWAATLCVTCSS